MLLWFNVHVTVHRNRFLCNKTNCAPVSQIYFVMKLYVFRTVRLSVIGNLFTVHSAMVQCVPLATEPSISLVILTPMKILQRNLNRRFVVWEMKRGVSVVRLIVAIRSSGPPASQVR